MLANLLTPRSISASRKLFHLLICCAYIPGLLYDVEFLTLCSFGMFILLSLIELIRYHGIGKLSEVIDDVMELFVDRKDCEGELILSHIYLLVGLSFPIWISDFHGNSF
jgi:dolichol kinase